MTASRLRSILDGITVDCPLAWRWRWHTWPAAILDGGRGWLIGVEYRAPDSETGRHARFCSYRAWVPVEMRTKTVRFIARALLLAVVDHELDEVSRANGRHIRRPHER